MDKNIKVALILSAVDRASAVLGKVFARAQGGAERLSAMSASMGMLGTQGIVAGGAMTAFFGHALKEAGEAAKATKVLNAVFDNLGEKGAEIAEQGKKFAEAYQFKIGINDEDIQAAETRLAVFHNLFTTGAQQAEIFQRATKAAFDMQAARFGDAESNAQKLGKLLNDPLNNLNALGKALGRINPLQKAHIKSLVDHRHAAAAQAYVLGLVEKRFQGAAEKTRTLTQLMRVQLHAINKSVGEQLRPAFTALMSSITSTLPKIIDFVKTHKSLVVAVAKGAAGLLLFSGGIKVMSFAFSGIAGVMKIAQGSVRAFGFIVANGGRLSLLAAKSFEALNFAFFSLQYAVKFTVIPMLQRAGVAFMEFGATLLANPLTLYIALAVAVAAAVYWIIKNWDKVSAFFKRLWAAIKAIFSATWDWIKNMFLNYTPQGLIIKHWDKIAGFFVGVWNNVKRIFSTAWQWISGLAAKFGEAGKNIVTSIAKGIWSVAMAPVRAIMWIVKKVRNFLPFSPAKEGPLRDIHRIKLVETIAASINAKPMIKAWGSATAGFRAAMIQQRPFQYAPAGGSVQIHFNPVINLHGSASAADGRMLTAQLRSEFDKMMRDYTQRNKRIGFNG